MTAVIFDKKVEASEETTIGTGTRFGSKTILFNDDYHTFQEVALQLVRATGCTYGQGMSLANVVDLVGSAIVYSGTKDRCEAVAGVLAEIGLKVAVEG